MLGATRMTDRLVFAYLTFRVMQSLLGRKREPFLFARDLGPGIQHDIAELPNLLDEKIAWIDIAVVLDYDIAIAGFMKSAVARLLPGEGLSDVVEKSKAYLPAFRPPQIERLHQKAAILLGRNGEW